MFEKLMVPFFSTNLNNQKAVSIIGGGFAGLFSGINLLQRGFSDVSIYEKSPQLGGPCNLVYVNNHPFELSTQMGRGALSILEDLGIPVNVESVNNELFYSDNTLITTPFNRMSKWNLLYPKSILTLLQNMSVAYDSEQFSKVLSGVNPKFKKMLLSMFAYPAANPQIETGHVRKFLKDPAGHSGPIIVKKGMWDVINTMETKFKELGGKIKFNEKCINIETGQDRKKTITTQQGSINTADIVISSSAWNNYPPESKPGLPLVSLFCEMHPEYKHPEGVHTTAFFPENIDHWFGLLSSEKDEPIPKEFGFHCFPNILPDNQKGITVFITTPRNTGHVDKQTKSYMEKYVINAMKKRFPGINKMITKTHCLSPAEFEEQFGFPSNAPTKRAPKGFSPMTYDLTRDLYFIGDSTFPQSPNIYGALQSAKNVTDTIIEHTMKNHNDHIEIGTNFVNKPYIKY